MAEWSCRNVWSFGSVCVFRPSPPKSVFSASLSVLFSSANVATERPLTVGALGAWWWWAPCVPALSVLFSSANVATERPLTVGALGAWWWWAPCVPALSVLFSSANVGHRRCVASLLRGGGGGAEGKEGSGGGGGGGMSPKCIVL